MQLCCYVAVAAIRGRAMTAQRPHELCIASGARCDEPHRHLRPARRAHRPYSDSPGGLAVAGAVLGIVGNQLVARYKLGVGRRIHSATLLADAKHSWLDALSSAGALVGLVLVALGHRWGDPLAGFAVTAFILHIGWQVTGDLASRLMDSLDPDDLHAARQAAAGLAGVRVLGVRGRWMGRSLLLEVDTAMDADQQFAAVDRACRQVERAVLDAVPHASQVRCIP